MTLRIASFSLSLLMHLTLLALLLLLLRLTPYKEEKVLEIDLSMLDIPKEEQIKSITTPEKSIVREVKASPKPLKNFKQPEEGKEREAEETHTVRPEPVKEELPKAVETPKASQETNQSIAKEETFKTSHTHEGKDTTQSVKQSSPNPSALQEQFIKEKLSVVSSLVQKNITYPPIARRMGWEGRVVLAITIREDGHLESVEIITSSGYEVLDRNAVEAVKKSCHLFPKPPVKVRVILPVAYKLE